MPEDISVSPFSVAVIAILWRNIAVLIRQTLQIIGDLFCIDK